MKKANKFDQPRQERRRNALERFTLDHERAAKDPGYKNRKEQERAALELRLAR